VPTKAPKRQRQLQRRLTDAEVAELVTAYEDHELVHEIAQRFGIHRTTVTALLRRHGVELRRAGLVAADIPRAAKLYGQGWSLARLGARYGVDSTTVWRALRAAGVAMRSPGSGR
jgi:transcriptional regulator of acetoin/glycerol metabolism